MLDRLYQTFDTLSLKGTVCSMVKRLVTLGKTTLSVWLTLIVRTLLVTMAVSNFAVVPIAWHSLPDAILRPTGPWNSAKGGFAETQDEENEASMMAQSEKNCSKG